MRFLHGYSCGSLARLLVPPSNAVDIVLLLFWGVFALCFFTAFTHLSKSLFHPFFLSFNCRQNLPSRDTSLPFDCSTQASSRPLPATGCSCWSGATWLRPCCSPWPCWSSSPTSGSSSFRPFRSSPAPLVCKLDLFWVLVGRCGEANLSVKSNWQLGAPSLWDEVAALKSTNQLHSKCLNQDEQSPEWF